MCAEKVEENESCGLTEVTVREKRYREMVRAGKWSAQGDGQCIELRRVVVSALNCNEQMQSVTGGNGRG